MFYHEQKQKKDNKTKYFGLRLLRDWCFTLKTSRADSYSSNYLGLIKKSVLILGWPNEVKVSYEDRLKI